MDTRMPIGTPVTYAEDNGHQTRTRTRSEPWQLGDGTWVVSLEGRKGGHMLARVNRDTVDLEYTTDIRTPDERANDLERVILDYARAANGGKLPELFATSNPKADGDVFELTVRRLGMHECSPATRLRRINNALGWLFANPLRIATVRQGPQDSEDTPTRALLDAWKAAGHDRTARP